MGVAENKVTALLAAWTLETGNGLAPAPAGHHARKVTAQDDTIRYFAVRNDLRTQLDQSQELA